MNNPKSSREGAKRALVLRFIVHTVAFPKHFRHDLAQEGIATHLSLPISHGFGVGFGIGERVPVDRVCARDTCYLLPPSVRSKGTAETGHLKRNESLYNRLVLAGRRNLATTSAYLNGSFSLRGRHRLKVAQHI